MLKVFIRISFSTIRVWHYEDFAVHHKKTCLFNIDALKPHFYIVKLGFIHVGV